jgi:hypothetical protein
MVKNAINCLVAKCADCLQTVVNCLYLFYQNKHTFVVDCVIHVLLAWSARGLKKSFPPILVVVDGGRIACFLPAGTNIFARHILNFGILYCCSCGFEPENWSLCLTISEKQTTSECE